MTRHTETTLNLEWARRHLRWFPKFEEQASQAKRDEERYQQQYRAAAEERAEVTPGGGA